LETIFKDFMVRRFNIMDKNKLNDMWYNFLWELKQNCSIVERM